jgi:enterochelin esterase-like enzyme
MDIKLKEALIILLPALLILLSGCSSSNVASVQSEAAMLPPTQTPPEAISSSTDSPSSIPTPTMSAEPVLHSGQIPTAIARTIDTAFPTKEPTPVPVPSPTATPEPSPTSKPCTGSGQIISGALSSETAGVFPYRIYLPPCYGDEERVYPTLYMFPGNIHTDGIWDALGLDEAAEAAIQHGEIPPLLIVMTSGGTLLNYTSGGPFSYESFILEEFIPYIEDEYCAWRDPAGRALGGISRGGYWSLEIAFRHPDQFISVGGHSASLYDLYGGPDLVPQSTGLANDLGNLRIYFDIGENDPLIYNLRKLHEDMEEVGREHVWVLNEGGHTDTYWASHVEEYIHWYAEPWSLQRQTYPFCSVNNEEGSSR